MAIDIRATVTCSLGQPILSGSISDDYLQGSGLVKTRGSLEVSALITPAVGTAVTFSYVKNGTTYSIPRKLRVLSSFADPFRRTTKIELGCKLTYLNDLKDRIKWDAFDDPENSTYTAEDDRIVTLPIRANSVMNKCLQELGISASANPLTNSFSIAEFDFSAGYVSVLNDLLVSESYFGYLDANEVLQVRTLVATGGSGPAFTAADIVDLGPIGVGQLPGEAVTVSYSTLKLKSPTEDQEQDEETKAKANWEEDESIGVPTTVRVENPFWVSNPFPFPVPQFFEYTYTPRSVSTTTYDALDRVVQRVTTEYTIMADIAPSYVQYIAGTAPANGPSVGSYEYTTISTEKFTYVVSANTPNIDPKNPPNGYEEIEEQVNTVEEPFVKLYASTPIYSILGETGDESLVGINLNNALKFVAEKTVTTTDYGVGRSNAQITKTISAKYICQAYTQEGQQSIASYIESNSGTENFADRVSSLLFQSSALTALGNEMQITTGREIGLQQRPSSAARTNDELNAAKDDPNADPNNGWRVASEAELELALGSSAAQRRIEFSMPYAPDDKFTGPTGGPFIAIPSDAPQKAATYGRAQNSLLLGNRSGMNLQLSPERMPTAPFDPLYVQASGLTALYRANGTSWAFDSNGIVASIDALFWGAVGGTGTFWFPVAPGITTLPAEPPIVDGEINANSVVFPYNETVIYDSRIRIPHTVTKFEYSLTLLTIVPALVIRTRTIAERILKVEVSNTINVTIAATAPQVSTGAAVAPPVTAIAVTATAPEVSGGASVTPPVIDIGIAVLTPVIETVSTEVLIPSVGVTVAVTAPEVSTGASVTVPIADVAVAALAPTDVGSVTDPSFANVSVLLHMDGANNSTTFTDSSSNNLAVGNTSNFVSITTAQSKFGGASANFSGTGSLNVPSGTTSATLAMGTGDFTAECWVRVSSHNATLRKIFQMNDGSERAGIFLGTTNVFTVRMGSTQITGTTVPAVDTWHHIAVTRNATVHKLWVNGVQEGGTWTNGYNQTNSRIDIGETGFTGWIDDLRVTKGVVRYTATFTPPTKAFPNQ